MLICCCFFRGGGWRKSAGGENHDIFVKDGPWWKGAGGEQNKQKIQTPSITTETQNTNSKHYGKETQTDSYNNKLLRCERRHSVATPWERPVTRFTGSDDITREGNVFVIGVALGSLLGFTAALLLRNLLEGYRNRAWVSRPAMDYALNAATTYETRVAQTAMPSAGPRRVARGPSRRRNNLQQPEMFQRRTINETRDVMTQSEAT